MGDQPRERRAQEFRDNGVFQVSRLVEGVADMAERDLVRQDQRLKPKLEHGAQRHERAIAAEAAIRRRTEREGAAAKRILAARAARETQSMVFFRSGGMEELYSGVAI
jgi:hypothetical protein